MFLYSGGSQRSGPAHSPHTSVHSCAKAEEENKNLSLRIQSGILGFEKEEQETKMPQKAQENLSDLITHQKKMRMLVENAYQTAAATLTKDTWLTLLPLPSRPRWGLNGVAVRLRFLLSCVPLSTLRTLVSIVKTITVCSGHCKKNTVDWRFQQ